MNLKPKINLTRHGLELAELERENTALKDRVEELVAHNQTLIQNSEDLKTQLSNLETDLAQTETSLRLRNEVYKQSCESEIKLRSNLSRLVEAVERHREEMKKLGLTFDYADMELYAVLDSIKGV